MPTPSFGKLATAPTKLVPLTITGNDHLLLSRATPAHCFGCNTMAPPLIST